MEFSSNFNFILTFGLERTTTNQTLLKMELSKARSTKIFENAEISTKQKTQSDISAMTDLMMIQVPVLFGQIRVRNLSEICYASTAQPETPQKNWWSTPLEEPEVYDVSTNVAKTTDVHDDKWHCIGCPKTFSKKCHLQRHEQTSDCSGSPKVKTSRWKCPTCLTTFARNEHFKRHLVSGSCNAKSVVNGCINDVVEKKVKKSFTIMDWLNRGPAIGKGGQKRKLDSEI